MKTASDYKVGSALAILLVGEQKSGKTNVAMSFPDPYVLDLDKNLDSAVRELAPDKKWWYDRPTDGLDMSKPEEAAKVYNKAMECLKAAVIDAQVKTIVIDSLSTLSLHMCDHILAEAARMEGKKIDKLRIQDYGSVLSLFQKLVGFLRACGKTVVLTSHQSWDKDDVTGAVRYTLNLPGQMKFNFGAFLTDVWGLMATPVAQGKYKYEIRTRPSGFHVALGTSIRAMPADIDITNLKPADIWTKLSPMLAAPASK